MVVSQYLISNALTISLSCALPMPLSRLDNWQREALPHSRACQIHGCPRNPSRTARFNPGFPLRVGGRMQCLHFAQPECFDPPLPYNGDLFKKQAAPRCRDKQHRKLSPPSFSCRSFHLFTGGMSSKSFRLKPPPLPSRGLN